MVSVPEFASKIRKKNNGAYADVDDAVLVEKYLEKHPIYRDRVQTQAPKPILGISEPPPAQVPVAEHPRPEPGFMPPDTSAFRDTTPQIEAPVASTTAVDPSFAAAEETHGGPELVEQATAPFKALATGTRRLVEAGGESAGLVERSIKTPRVEGEEEIAALSGLAEYTPGGPKGPETATIKAFVPKPVTKMTDAEVKRVTSPTMSQRVARALASVVPDQWVEDVAKVSGGEITLDRFAKDPVGWAATALTNAAEQVPLLAQQVTANVALPGFGVVVGGAAMMSAEMGNFLQGADAVGGDLTPRQKAQWQRIVDKYAPVYGISSGMIEYAGNAGGAVGALKGIKGPLQKVLLERLAGIFGEGVEELTQTGMMNVLMSMAIDEMKAADSSFETTWTPESKWEAFKRGVVVSGILQTGTTGVQVAMQQGQGEQQEPGVGTSLLGEEVSEDEGTADVTQEGEPLSDEDKAKIDEFLTTDITKLAEKRAITQSPYTIENIAKQILKDTPSLTEEEAFDVADKTTRHPKTGLPGEAHLQSFMARPVKEGHVRMYAMRDGDNFGSWNGINHTAGDLAMGRMQGTFNEDIVQNEGYEDFHIMGDEGATGIEVPVNDAGQGVVDVLWNAKTATNNKPIRISDDVTLPLGVSIGVGETLAEADEALKQAKKSGGRNGVYVAESLKSKYNMSDRLGEDYTEQYRNAGMKIREEVKDADQDVGREEDTGDEQGTGAPAPAPAVTKAPASKAKAPGQRTDKASGQKPVRPPAAPKPKATAETKPPPKKAPATPKPPGEQAGFITITKPEIQTAKQRVPEGAKKAYKTYVQEKQVGLLESDRAVNKVQQQVKGAEAEVVPFLIEGTRVPKELNRPDIEKIFNDPTKRKRLMGVAKEAREHFHRGWQRMQERLPDMSATELENYVTHVWDIPKNNIKDAVNWFSTRNPFLKKRFISTYAEGIKRGYKPKTLDIAKLMHIHDQYVVKTTENVRLVEELKKLQDDEGVKLIQRADKAPEDWIMSDHPVLRRAMYVPGQEQTLTKEGEPILKKGTRVVVVGKQGPAKIISVDEEAGQAEVMFKAEDGTETFKVALDRLMPEKGTSKDTPASMIKVPVRYHPDLQPLMDAVFSTQAPSRGLGPNLVKAYDVFNAVLKKLQLTVSLFHHVALGEAGIATMGPQKFSEVAFNARKIFNALAKKKYDIYEKNYDLAKDGVKHGLQLGAIADVHRSMVDEALGGVRDELAKVNKWAGAPVTGLRKANTMWDRLLWDYYHNELKLYGYESLVGNALAKNTDDTKSDAIKEEVAQFINDTYGGQNWELMMTNPKTLRVFQRLLLSPDWTLSTIKQALSPTGLGAVHKEGRGLRMKMGAAFWASAAFWFGGGINLLNQAFTLWDDKEEKEKAGKKWSLKDAVKEGRGKFLWENDPGHKTHLFVGRYPDGSKRYVRWGKQFRELPELFYDASAQELSPISATLKKLGGKTTPAIQMVSAVFTGYTPSGYKVSDIADNAGWSRIGAIAKHIVSSPLPFSLKNASDETKDFHLSDLAFPSSKGMTYHKTRKMFKFALLKRKEKGVYNVFEAAVENNLDAWSILEDAIREIKAEAMSGLSRDVRLGKTPQPEIKDGAVVFPENTTVGQAMAWDKNQMRDAKKMAFLDNWETLLAAAKERYNAYLEEQKMLTSPLPVGKK